MLHCWRAFDAIWTKTRITKSEIVKILLHWRWVHQQPRTNKEVLVHRRTPPRILRLLWKIRWYTMGLRRTNTSDNQFKVVEASRHCFALSILGSSAKARHILWYLPAGSFVWDWELAGAASEVAGSLWEWDLVLELGRPDVLANLSAVNALLICFLGLLGRESNNLN